MSDDRDTLKLSKTANHDSCAQLATDLTNCRGKPIRIVADDVDQIGVLGAQLLLVAKQTWAAEEVPFEIVDPSDGFHRSVQQLGLSEALLEGDS